MGFPSLRNLEVPEDTKQHRNVEIQQLYANSAFSIRLCMNTFTQPCFPFLSSSFRRSLGHGWTSQIETDGYGQRSECVLKVPMTDISVCLGGEQLWVPCGLLGTNKAAQSVMSRAGGCCGIPEQTGDRPTRPGISQHLSLFTSCINLTRSQLNFQSASGVNRLTHIPVVFE